MDTGDHEELSRVVQAMEEEFRVLNKRYQELTKQASGDQPAPPEYAEELLEVIQQLQAKGYQLHLLKR